MSDKRVIFVMGLQGVGKSRYIAEHYPEAARVDFEYWWENPIPTMSGPERATWVKLMAQSLLIYLLREGASPILVECTGMSKVNQAGVKAMMVEAASHDYRTVLVYLKPQSLPAYVEAIQDDPGARSMFEDWRDPDKAWKWREPHQCPYFSDVKVVGVDHSAWERQAAPAVFAIERT